MTRPRRRRPEDEAQKAVVDYLDAVLVPSYRVFAIPNASRRTASGKPTNAVPGLRPGVPDLAVTGMGRVYFIEMKSPKGELSEAQEEWANWCCTRGSTPWCLARSVADVKEALTHWGIKTRESV